MQGPGWSLPSQDLPSWESTEMGWEQGSLESQFWKEPQDPAQELQGEAET